MQVNIDNFFKEQNENLQIDVSKQDLHWQQMQKKLLPNQPKIKSWKSFAITALLLAIITTTIVLINKDTKQENIVQTTLPKPTEEKNAKSTSQPLNKTIQQTPLSTPKSNVIKKSLPAPAQHKTTDPIVNKENTSSTTIQKEAKFYIDLTKEPEIFTINPTKQNAITCKQGTIITIPANIVTKLDGTKVTEEVSVIVQEYYRYDDEGVSIDKVNAGMLKYEVYSGNEKLMIQNSKSVDIKLKSVLGIHTALKIISSEDVMPETKLKELNWVSAENFTADKREKIDYRITLDKKYDASRFMSEIAFPKQNVIMAGDIVNNTIIFHNVPIGETVYFMSIGKINDKYFSCSKKLITGNTNITELDFVEISETLYKKQIEELGKLGQ